MISTSYLTSVFTSRVTGLPTLHQSKITDTVEYDSFETFAADFLARATFPRPQASKTETYGFVPTVFMPGFNQPKNGREPEWGNWRIGDLAADTVSLLVMDLDNADSAKPYVTMAEAADVLDGMGLSYLLYTSYSHADAKPKFRLILPTDRDLTYAEAFDGYRWFDQRLGGQLDGSIYSPGDYIYGPPHGAEVRVRLDGRPVRASEIVTGLPAMVCASHQRRVATAEQRMRLKGLSADMSARPDVTIENAAICKPEWVGLLTGLYKEGSHSQSLMGVLTKIWLKSGGTLTAGEMHHLYRELDSHYGGYCRSKYGAHEVSRTIESVMSKAVTPPAIASRQYNPGEAYELLKIKMKAMKKWK